MSLYERMLRRDDTESDKDFRKYLVSGDETLLLRRHSFLRLLIQAVENKNKIELEKLTIIKNNLYSDIRDSYPKTMADIERKLSYID